MCGIAGIVTPTNAIEYKNNLESMTHSIAHRGPDGDGHYYFNGCALGHRRLSIVDIAGSPQPMLFPDKQTGLVFNGEIYGYKAIREQISYPYNTSGDTELLLVMYKEYGERMPEYLPGMFSFAIWDENRKKLFCARDRFGEKPFYYATGKNGEFIFASEIKCILASGLVDPIVDESAVAHYMQHLYVHPHTSVYKNIHVLPPAHALTFERETGKITTRRYWNLPAPSSVLTLKEAAEKFAALFDDAIRKQMVADVPLGAFLSGGLDSSSVVAVASKYKKGIKTIAFGFGDSINELPFAKAIGQKYGTDHVEIQQPEADIASLLLTMNSIYDEPYADSSNIPTYLISKYAREHLTVVLTGDAGDELCGGYSSYKTMLEMMKGKKTNESMIPLLKFYLKLRRKLNVPANEKHLAAAMMNTKYPDLLTAHSNMNVYFGKQELEQLGITNAATAKRFSFTPNNSPDDGMRADIEDYMPGDILVKTDRASMASSLELRAPFLDVPFAEFCMSLPYNLKLNATSDKIILREAMSHLWTEAIRKRSKQGFGAPVNKWLQLKEVKALKEEFLLNRNNKIFDHISYDANMKYYHKDNYHTWILLVLSLWYAKR